MTIQELETQLLKLDPSVKLHMIQLLAQSLIPQEVTLSTHLSDFSFVEFFRNSPLREVAEEIDLDRDQSVIPNRVSL